MKISTNVMAAVAVAMILPVAAPSYAGPASDALSDCLIQKSSKADRADLARWVFAVMARHPGVAELATMDDAKYVEVNQKAGALFTRLMAKDCAKQSAEAIKTEGTDSFGKAFEGLGKMAMQELMGDPAVQQGMSDLLSYVDTNAITQAMMSQK